MNRSRPGVCGTHEALTDLVGSASHVAEDVQALTDGVAVTSTALGG